MVLFSLELHCFTGLSHKLPTGVTFSVLSSRVSSGYLDGRGDLITLVTLIFIHQGFSATKCHSRRIVVVYEFEFCLKSLVTTPPIGTAERFFFHMFLKS